MRALPNTAIDRRLVVGGARSVGVGSSARAAGGGTPPLIARRWPDTPLHDKKGRSWTRPNFSGWLTVLPGGPLPMMFDGNGLHVSMEGESSCRRSKIHCPSCIE